MYCTYIHCRKGSYQSTCYLLPTLAVSSDIHTVRTYRFLYIYVQTYSAIFKLAELYASMYTHASETEPCMTLLFPRLGLS